MKSGTEIKKAFEQFATCTPVLFCLIDEIRQDIVIQLAGAGPQGLCVNDITAGGNLSRPAISHHLKVLKSSGLVKSRKQGTQVFYYLYLEDHVERMKGLIEAITAMIDYAKKDEELRKNLT